MQKWLAVVAVSCTLGYPMVSRSAEPFKDADEGLAGPLQKSFEDQIVFANSFIERADADPKKIVSETTLTKPLFLRFFRSKTPARILHEQGKDDCFGTQRFDQTYAHLEGHEKDSFLINDSNFGDKTFKESRSASITIDGNKVSLLPQERLNITLAPMEHKAFIALVGMMKPGNNRVIFENFVGCQTIENGQKPAITGSLTFVLKAGDLASYARRVGPDLDPNNANGASQKVVEAAFRKSMVKGSSILKFVAEQTETEPMESKTTPLRAFLHNAEGTCSYVEGFWKQKYVGGGQFDVGHFEASETKGFGNQIPIPCP